MPPPAAAAAAAVPGARERTPMVRRRPGCFWRRLVMSSRASTDSRGHGGLNVYLRRRGGADPACSAHRQSRTPAPPTRTHAHTALQ